MDNINKVELCPRCGHAYAFCECKSDPRIHDETSWNGELQMSDLAEHTRKFSEEIAGHIRREFAYRKLAAELLANVRSLENFVGPTTRPLLHDAIGVWEARLERIANL